MTKTTEALAREAGARFMHTEDQHEVICFQPAQLARFEALARADERERCAGMRAALEIIAAQYDQNLSSTARQNCMATIASAAIRAVSESAGRSEG